MRLHYLQHVPFEDLAGIKDWAKDRGHQISRTLLFDGQEAPGIDEFDWLVIMGGPMMGFALPSMDIPITKGTSGIIALSKQSLLHSEEFGPCIRCGRCIDVCPMGLVPSMLGVLSEKGFYEEAKAYRVHDCFECGSCTYVCPAKRPIVQFVKLTKSLVKP